MSVNQRSTVLLDIYVSDWRPANSRDESARNKEHQRFGRTIGILSFIPLDGAFRDGNFKIGDDYFPERRQL